MGLLGFLVPAFLAGLVALAVPILVHLRHRERTTPVRFPSLMFLRRVPFREVSRQQIHHWPLFILRCLVVVLLALAFARPFLADRGRVGSIAARTGRDVVLLVDQSASMAHGDRWARARRAVEREIGRLGGADRAALVLFDASARVAAPLTADREVLRAAVAEAAPTAQPTRFAPALRAAREILVGSDRPGLEVVLVSDFQRSGWRGEEFDPLPEGTVLRREHLGGPQARNTAVVGVEVLPAGADPGRMTVAAQVLTTGGARPAGTARLLLEGREAARRPVPPGEGLATVTFEAVERGADAARAVVVVEPGDSLPGDDRYHFVAFRDRPIRVVLSRAAGDGSRAFLQRALAISRRPRVTVTTRSGPPDARDLAAADVVILEDLPFPAGAAGERLAAFVRGGGGLVQVLGPGASGRWPAGLPEFAVGDVVDRDAAGGGTFGVLRREHPVFEPFRGPGSGDFAAARIFRYRRVRGDSLDVLASYDDGAPALLEGAAGAGRLLVLTSPADNVWSDLPLQPVFLPLAHQLVLHAAGYVERPPAHAVGEVATVAEGLGGEAVVIVTPSGDRTRREAGTGPVAVTVAEAGFHEVREARAGGRLLALLAGNSPAEEANLASFDPEDLMVAAGARDSVSRMAAAVPAEDLTALERERAQGLWWYLLAGALLLLAVEALLANRLAGFVGAETQAAPEAS